MKAAQGTETRRPPVLSLVELRDYLQSVFPQALHEASGLTVEACWHGGALLRQDIDQSHLRPGGTVSGPTIMALADVAMYAAVLSAIGRVPLAVTVNFSINFLRKPGRDALHAEAAVLKLGKRLAVGEIVVMSADIMVAHATSTYSIPN